MTKIEKNITAGAFVKYTCADGSAFTCKVFSIKGDTAKLKCKNGITMFASIADLTPTADNVLTMPEWLKKGQIITNGVCHQRVIDIVNDVVLFDWINGGYFQSNIEIIIKNWRPSDRSVCEVIEAA